MVERIVLYKDIKRASPYPEGVEFVLLETGAQHTVYDKIDLMNKPAWFKKVNPRGLVPALTYGGPDVPPDQPSAESIKLAESLVLMEFVADLFPGSGLMPSDPVARAQVRLFAEAATRHFGRPLLFDFMRDGFGKEVVLLELAELQEMFTAGSQFAVGNKFTVADAALAPMLWRFETCLEHDLGMFSLEDGRDLLKAYESDQFGRIRKYFESIKARPGFKQAMQSEEKMIESLRARYVRN